MWCRELTIVEIDELDAALRHVRHRNPALDLASMTVDDFPLPTFTAEIDNLRRVLVDGCGMFAYTGVPVERYDDDELRALWWGLCLSIGTPVAQSWRGDVIGDVRDIGTGVTGRAGRGYTSNAELSFHCDTADVTGLFFLRQGKTGGVSRIASSVAVHNEIADAAPTCSSCSTEPMPVSWQSNEVPGTQQWYEHAGLRPRRRRRGCRLRADQHPVGRRELRRPAARPRNRSRPSSTSPPSPPSRRCGSSDGSRRERCGSSTTRRSSTCAPSSPTTTIRRSSGTCSASG